MISSRTPEPLVGDQGGHEGSAHFHQAGDPCTAEALVAGFQAARGFVVQGLGFRGLGFRGLGFRGFHSPKP